MSPGQQLRRLLAGPKAILVPGAANALTARIAEEAGFPAVLFTGAGFANMELADPDLGLTTLTEVVQQVGRMVDAVDIPVVADADTGFGNPLNVRRTVRELERAGAAAIILEDQVSPKRCGHFEGKQVIGRDEMVMKLVAALEARRHSDTLIVARTDARAVFGLEDAIARVQAYEKAGVDATFVEAPRTVEELAQIPRSLGVPQMCNMVEGGKTPVLPRETLEAMGYRLICYANAALRGAIQGMQTVLQGLARDGTTDKVLDQMVSWQERQRLVRLPEYNTLEAQYAAPPAGTSR